MNSPMVRSTQHSKCEQVRSLHGYPNLLMGSQLYACHLFELVREFEYQGKSKDKSTDEVVYYHAVEYCFHKFWGFRLNILRSPVQLER